MASSSRVSRKTAALLLRASRFSLRSLLLLTVACCAVLGVWTVHVQPFRDQAASLKGVTEMGGTFETVRVDGPAWRRWIVQRMVGPDSYVHVRRVDLRGRTVSADGVSALAGLRFLENLYLDRAEVNDDAALALAPMQGLQELSLCYTGLSDQGLVRLGPMPHLRTLYLTGVPVSDASVDNLARHAELAEVYLRWTGFTASGVAELKARLPQCAVHHHQLPHPQVDEATGG
ncbi:MAG: hypothetical protein IT424_14860 [Pirellulales bacterium]|nr:hypothetical protein [Pirellulales bacterium]